MSKRTCKNIHISAALLAGYILITAYIFSITIIEWLDRILVYLFALLVMLYQHKTNKLHFASPLSILGGICLFAYCVIPSLYIYLWQINIISKENIPLNDLVGEAALFIGGNAEKSALIFAISCWLGNLFLIRDTNLKINLCNMNSNILGILMIGMSMAVFMVNKYGYHDVSTIKSVMATNILFLLSLFVFVSRQNISKALFGIVVVTTLLALAMENKRLSLFIIYISIIILTTYKIDRRKIIIGGLLIILVFIALLMNITSRDDKGSVWTNLQETISAKIFRRQIITNKCFAFVVDRHWNVPGERNPFYFVEGLVPRFIWKDKPNISNGAFYEREYCEYYYKDDIAYANSHSSSITLLGEPLLRAGKIGFIIDVSLLIAALAWITRKAHQKGPIGLATMGAMTPWLVDFDQDFTLYVANAVKFFLCLLPLVLLAHSWEKRLGIKHEPAYRPDS